MNVTQKAEDAISRVVAFGGEINSIFVEFYPRDIRDQAQMIDARIAAGETELPLAGWLISIKDLFDEVGKVTSAGSRLLGSASPALQDCDVVRRLKDNGAVIFGRTAMSEFAYSGVGLNPHFGTPGNYFDREHIPGGSSSGAALSVAHGFCDAAIGTDTGGSVRIPAAANGLFGYKPSQQAVSMEGVHPLSPTLDSVGPLAKSLPELLTLQRVLTGISLQVKEKDTSEICVGLPVGAFLDGLDETTIRSWELIKSKLSLGGGNFKEVDLQFLAEALPLARVIISSEAFAQYRLYLEQLETLGDPRVLQRIKFAKTLSAEEIENAYNLREKIIGMYETALCEVDVLLAPTLPILPPRIDDVEADFDRLNALMLRNPSMINIANGCAVTLPVFIPDAVFPGAAMLAAANGNDLELLSAAQSLVQHISGSTI